MGLTRPVRFPPSCAYNYAVRAIDAKARPEEKLVTLFGTHFCHDVAVTVAPAVKPNLKAGIFVRGAVLSMEDSVPP